MAADQSFVISTIVQPIQEMAYHSVQTILSMISNEEFRKRILLPVMFKEGNTTKVMND
jgi:DNA-binding LacI/PurR family transcriptional regulator